MMEKRENSWIGRVRHRMYSDAFLLSLLIVINWIWFLPLMSRGIIAGDDIGLIARFTEIDGKAFLTDVLLGYQEDLKYRPVLNLIQYCSTSLFGTDYALYFVLNLFVNSLIIAALYGLLRCLTENKAVCALISLMYIACPSLYYAVTQVYGIMEAVCVLFLILVVRFGIAYFRTGRMASLLSSLFFACLAIFTHERFIVLFPVYIVLILMRGRENLIRNLALVSVPFAFNFFFKTAVLGLPFFQGTGGTSIAFDPLRIVSFFFTGLAGIFGFNIGMDHMVGYAFALFSPLEKGITIAAAALAVGMFAAYMFKHVFRTADREERVRTLQVLFLAVCAIGATLLSGCVTVRLEMRWLVAPYVVFLVYFCYIASKARETRKKRIGTALVGLICLANIFNAVQYRDYADGLFFMRAMKLGRSVYEETIQKYGESLADSRIVLVGSNELSWTVGNLGTTIFDLCLDSDVDYLYLEDRSELDGLDMDEGATKIFVELSDLTVRELKSLQYDVSCDLSEEELHSVSPDTPTEAPSKRGVCFLNEFSFTILSGYTDTLEEIRFPKQAILYFEPRIEYSKSDGATLGVMVWNGESVVYKEEFELITGEYDPIWIELQNEEAFTGNIVFYVTSPTGDDTGDWVTLVEPSVLRG